MKFTTVVAAILSMAAIAIAAPTPVAEDVQARQNHGMCVKANQGQIEQIPNC
ncbi:uncharacterized protein EI97DRAFT_456876 [Westerdykella ornata]|uniref:Uncharacterized protein n=1 Tax=Westerdykella ornata TaxID=318751 RepID=A0A6A6JTY7_WESOR|nr:uncharacterized protein EI97DRAFT_456876 [Westerdykella ornata]KAF2278489.1 hypothetical protein EI97DRAFT_456876 [Westerdykella ornata]